MKKHHVFRDLFSFHGRLNRRSFARRMAFLCLIFFVIAFAFATIGTALHLESQSRAMILPFAIPAVIAVASLTIRRLHDRGKSAWWLALYASLIVGGVSIVDRLVSSEQFGPFHPIVIVLVVANLAMLVWAVVDICVLRGVDAENEYR